MQFRQLLDEAFSRVDVWNIEVDQADVGAGVCQLVLLACCCWRPIQGIISVMPLSYVVCKKEEVAEPASLVGKYGSFNERSIACAPLQRGPTFHQANARKEYQLLKRFLKTETVAEQWIKLIARRQIGR